MEDIYLLHNLESILVKLKVISLCEPDQRLIFKGNYISIQNNNFFTPVIRYISDQSRKDIIDGLKFLLTEIERLIKDITSKKINALKHLERIRQNIANVLIHDSDHEHGLYSLLITYKDDQLYTAEILNIIEMYQNVLDDLNDKLKE